MGQYSMRLLVTSSPRALIVAARMAGLAGWQAVGSVICQGVLLAKQRCGQLYCTVLVVARRFPDANVAYASR